MPAIILKKEGFSEVGSHFLNPKTVFLSCEIFFLDSSILDFNSHMSICYEKGRWLGSILSCFVRNYDGMSEMRNLNLNIGVGKMITQEPDELDICFD